MELDPVILSRIQFAFVISFHIIFPAFTIGLAAWLATLEAAHLATGRAIYRRVFEFWMKVFAVSFGMGVVTGIVMAFQFGTNWGVLAEKMGSVQGPLLGYEGFTAFMLEATFFGVMLLGRERVSPRFYLFACCMVALGTMFSSFWIMANNSWMQVPVGHAVVDGRIVPTDWWAIVAGPVMQVRWPHMLLGAFLTTGMCIIATGAWYLLRRMHHAEAHLMLNWGLGTGGAADSAAAVRRPPHRRLRAPAPAGQIRRDRGTLADRAAGARGADRLARRSQRTQPLRAERASSGQLHRLGHLGFARSRADRLSPVKTGRRC